MVRSLALRQEVHVWPNQGSTCLAQAIVRLMHRNPQTALPSQNTHILFSTLVARTQRQNASGNFANLPRIPTL